MSSPPALLPLMWVSLIVAKAVSPATMAEPSCSSWRALLCRTHLHYQLHSTIRENYARLNWISTTNLYTCTFTHLFSVNPRAPSCDSIACSSELYMVVSSMTASDPSRNSIATVKRAVYNVHVRVYIYRLHHAMCTSLPKTTHKQRVAIAWLCII